MMKKSNLKSAIVKDSNTTNLSRILAIGTKLPWSYNKVLYDKNINEGIALFS